MTWAEEMLGEARADRTSDVRRVEVAEGIMVAGLIRGGAR